MWPVGTNQQSAKKTTFVKPVYVYGQNDIQLKSEAGNVAYDKKGKKVAPNPFKQPNGFITQRNDYDSYSPLLNKSVIGQYPSQNANITPEQQEKMMKEISEAEKKSGINFLNAHLNGIESTK